MTSSTPFWKVQTPFDSVPLNVTSKVLAVTMVSVAASTASPVGWLALNAATKNILVIPTVIPTASIFVNYWVGSNTDASASVNDIALTETYPSIQVGRKEETTHVSFFSTSAQTVLVYEFAA